MNSKVETYIGFAIKKGSVVYGCDNICRFRKKIYVILHTESLSENSLSMLKSFSSKNNLPLVQIGEIPVLLNKNCKALAICDKSLACAIINNLK